MQSAPSVRTSYTGESTAVDHLIERHSIRPVNISFIVIKQTIAVAIGALGDGG
jgi:hypothetical protein